MVFFFQMRLEKVFFIRTNENAVLHQIRLVFDESLPSYEAFFTKTLTLKDKIVLYKNLNLKDKIFLYKKVDSKRQNLFIQKHWL